MSRVPIEIPKIGLVMESVRVTRWLKDIGDKVALGEPLLEVETEKSVVEIEAAQAGRLEQILVAVGEEAKVGDQIAWLATEGAAPTPASRAPAPALPAAPPAPKPAPPKAQTSGRIRSTPAARHAASERGVDLRAMAGSGPNGRVQLADVTSASGQATASSTGGPSANSVPMTPMQRALARSMTLSNATVPQFTVERSVDGTALQGVRAAYAASKPTAASLSVNDFLLQALARTLIELPALNAIYADEGAGAISRSRGTHIGLVVAVAGGLLVPVLHDVERLSLSELATLRRDCMERALQGKLRRDELSGSTCSLSNLGAQGPDRFAAMINPPESAILAVGRQRECVVPRAGGLAIRPMSDLTLTVDHRVANGRQAADFLARLVQILESADWRL